MKEIKFRNHYSVVIEKLGAFFVVMFVLVLQNIDDVAEILIEVGKIKILRLG